MADDRLDEDILDAIIAQRIANQTGEASPPRPEEELEPQETDDEDVALTDAEIDAAIERNFSRPRPMVDDDEFEVDGETAARDRALARDFKLSIPLTPEERQDNEATWRALSRLDALKAAPKTEFALSNARLAETLRDQAAELAGVEVAMAPLIETDQKTMFGEDLSGGAPIAPLDEPFGLTAATYFPETPVGKKAIATKRVIAAAQESYDARQAILAGEDEGGVFHRRLSAATRKQQAQNALGTYAKGRAVVPQSRIDQAKADLRQANEDLAAVSREISELRGKAGFAGFWDEEGVPNRIANVDENVVEAYLGWQLMRKQAVLSSIKGAIVDDENRIKGSELVSSFAFAAHREWMRGERTIPPMGLGGSGTISMNAPVTTAVGKLFKTWRELREEKTGDVLKQDGHDFILTDEQLDEFKKFAVIMATNDMAGILKDIADVRKDKLPVDLEPRTLSFYFAEAIGSTIESSPGLFASAITGSVAPALLYGMMRGGGHAYLEGIDAIESGKSNATLADVRAYAAWGAAAEGLGETISAWTVGRILKSPDVFRGVMAGVVNETTAETITEAITLAAGKEYGIHPNMTMKEAGRRLFDAGVIGGMSGGIIGAGAGAIGQTMQSMTDRMNRRARERLEAARAGDTALDQLTMATQATKEAIERDPEGVEEIFTEQNAGTPFETMHVDSRDLVGEDETSLFQTEQEAEDYFAEKLGVDREAFRRARKKGGDISFPTARFQVRIVGQEEEGFFRETARFDPEHESVRDRANRARRAAQVQIRTEIADQIDIEASFEGEDLQLYEELKRDLAKVTETADEAETRAAYSTAVLRNIARSMNKARGPDEQITGRQVREFWDVTFEKDGKGETSMKMRRSGPRAPMTFRPQEEIDGDRTPADVVLAEAEELTRDPRVSSAATALFEGDFTLDEIEQFDEADLAEMVQTVSELLGIEGDLDLSSLDVQEFIERVIEEGLTPEIQAELGRMSDAFDESNPMAVVQRQVLRSAAANAAAKRRRQAIEDYRVAVQIIASDSMAASEEGSFVDFGRDTIETTTTIDDGRGGAETIDLKLEPNRLNEDDIELDDGQILSPIGVAKISDLTVPGEEVLRKYMEGRNEVDQSGLGGVRSDPIFVMLKAGKQTVVIIDKDGNVVRRQGDVARYIPLALKAMNVGEVLVRQIVDVQGRERLEESGAVYWAIHDALIEDGVAPRTARARARAAQAYQDELRRAAGTDLNQTVETGEEITPVRVRAEDRLKRRGSDDALTHNSDAKDLVGAARNELRKLFEAEGAPVEKVGAEGIDEILPIVEHPDLGEIYISRAARGTPKSQDYSTVGKFGDTRHGARQLLAVPMLAEVLFASRVSTRGGDGVWKAHRDRPDDVTAAARKAAEGVREVSYLDAVVTVETDQGARNIAVQMLVQRRVVGTLEDGTEDVRAVLYSIKAHRKREGDAVLRRAGVQAIDTPTDAAEGRSDGDLAQFVLAESLVAPALIEEAEFMWEKRRDPLTGDQLSEDDIEARDQIVIRTGLFRSTDGEFEVEVSDREMSISEEIWARGLADDGVSGAFGDLVVYDLLYRIPAYRHLRHIPLTLYNRPNEEERAQLTADHIWVQAPNLERALEAVAHELSHAIRYAEGRESGASPSTVDPIIRIARQRRYDLALDAAEKTPFGKELAKRLKKAGLEHDNVAVAEILLKIYHTTRSGDQDIGDEIYELLASMGDNVESVLQEAYRSRAIAEDPFAAYLAQVGEQYAEMIEERLNMTEEERKAQPPRFPLEQLATGLPPLVGVRPILTQHPLLAAARKQELALNQSLEELTDDQVRELQEEELAHITSVWKWYREAQKAKRSYKPRSIVQFIRDMGGITDEGGDFRVIFDKPSNLPGFFNFKNGISPDAMGELLWEEGYFDERPDINEIWNAVSDEWNMGHKLYASEDRAFIQDIELAEAAAEEVLEEFGFDITDIKIEENIATRYDVATYGEGGRREGARPTPLIAQRGFGEAVREGELPLGVPYQAELDLEQEIEEVDDRIDLGFEYQGNRIDMTIRFIPELNSWVIFRNDAEIGRAGDLISAEKLAANLAQGVFQGSLDLNQGIPEPLEGFATRIAMVLPEIASKANTPQGWKSELKARGVTPTEFDALGWDAHDWGKAKPTREDVEEFVAANQPDLEIVELGGEASAENQAEIRQLIEEAKLDFLFQYGEAFVQAAPLFSDLIRRKMEDSGNAKYSKLRERAKAVFGEDVLENAENYTFGRVYNDLAVAERNWIMIERAAEPGEEKGGAVVVLRPDGTIDEYNAFDEMETFFTGWAQQTYEFTASELHQIEGRVRRDYEDEGVDGGTLFPTYQIPGGKNYREILARDNKKEGEARSPHFEDSESFFAQVSDFQVEGFGKTLVATSIQSDIHQVARRRGGYRLQGDALLALLEERNRATEKVSAAQADVRSNFIDVEGEVRRHFVADQDTALIFLKKIKHFTEEDARRTLEKEGVPSALVDEVLALESVSRFFASRITYQEAEEAWAVASRAYNAAESGPVRVALEKNWHEVGIKQLLRMAVVEGYDAFALPTPTQAELAARADAGELAVHYGKTLPKFLEKYVKRLGGRVERGVAVSHSNYNLDEWAFQKGLQLDVRDDESAIDGIARAYDADKNHIVRITPEMREALSSRPQPLYQGRRGALSPEFDDKGLLERATIKFSEDQNLSTFVHEFGGHLVFEIYRWVVAQENAPPDIVRDFNLIMKFTGVTDPTVFDELQTRDFLDEKGNPQPLSWISANEGVEMATRIARRRRAVEAHEKFSAAMELYMLEGRPPTQGLQGLFARIASRLKLIYSGVREAILRQRLKGADPLQQNNVDIRPVMDRIIAAEEEIADARERSGANPLFRSPGLVGMTAREYEVYRRAVEKEEEEVHSRAIGVALKELGKERDAIFDQNVKETLPRAEKRVKETKVYRAWRTLTTKGAPRIDKAELEEAFPDLDLSSLPKDRSRPLFAKRSKKDADLDHAGDPVWSLDRVVQALGYGTAQELITDLKQFKGLAEEARIEAEREVSAAMAAVDEKFRNGKLRKAVNKVLHEGASMQVAEAEVRALARGADAVGINARNARVIAEAELEQMKVEDALREKSFLATERRHSDHLREAWARLSAEIQKHGRKKVGSVVALFEEALRYAEQRLLSKALYRLSRELDDEIAVFKRKVKSYERQIKRAHSGKPGEVRKNSIAADKLLLIEELLERFEFKDVTKKRRQERVSYAAWRQRMIDEGREAELVDVHAKISEETGVENYKDLTVDQLRSVIEAVENLAHIGRLKRKLKAAADKRRHDEKIDDLRSSIEKRAVTPRQKSDGARNANERRASYASSGWMHLMDAPTIVEAHIDAGEVMGRGFDYIIAPLEKGMRALTEMMMGITARWNEINAVYSEKEWQAMQRDDVVPGATMPDGSPIRISKVDALAVALNWGNEGNRTAIMESERYRGSKMVEAETWLPTIQGETQLMPAPIKAILETLDKRDWAWVQSVWDLFESYRPQMAAKEERLTGVAPRWVDATPVVNEHGEFRGGYYPLRYGDSLTYGTIEADPASQGDLLSPENTQRRGKAGTKRAHFIERKGSNGRNVLFDLAVMFQHGNAMIYDLALGEGVAEVSAILKDPRFRKAMSQAGRDAGLIELDKMLRDVAQGELAAGDFWNRAMRGARANLTYGALAYSSTSAIVQPTGLLQSWATIGLAKSDMWFGLSRAFVEIAKKMRGAPSEIDRLYETSPLMRERVIAINKEMADMQKQLRWTFLSPILGKRRAAVVTELGYILINILQRTVDVPTYFAAERQAIRQGKTGDAVNRYAENMVQKSQGGQSLVYRSAWERGSAGSLESGTWQAEAIKNLSILATYFYIKPRIMYLRGLNIVHDKEARAAHIANFLGTGLVIFTMEAVLSKMLIELARGDDWWEELDDRGESHVKHIAAQTAYTAMAGIPFLNFVGSEAQGYRGGSAFGLTAKQVTDLFMQVEQGEVDWAMIRAAVKAAGIFTPIPSSQGLRTSEAFWKQAEQDVEFNEFIFGLDRD